MHQYVMPPSGQVERPNLATVPGAQRLIIVSNRLPLTVRRTGQAWRAEPSAGGLATALSPLVRESNGIWIGSAGDVPLQPDPARDALLAKWAEQERYVAIDLPADVNRLFYEGYANQTLWPLFHHFPSRLEFKTDAWEAYVKANALFRDAILQHLQPNDLVWIHDYHLMLLPQMLRQAAPQAKIGFFLHIPFPSSEVLRILPKREQLLQGLLGADFLAFQTHSHLQHLRASLLRILGVTSRMDRVAVDQRFIHLAAHPIGLAPDAFTSALDNDTARQHIEDVKRRHHGKRILLGVDRLDYTKGIPERLRTFRRLLQRAPYLREKVVLIQVAVPSRERIPEYESLHRTVNELVGEINGAFATPNWTPVEYIRRGIPRHQLVALYAAADVGWVTPLRDGMNLVAKEYVVCQKDQDGILLLSEFAGAAAEMGEAFLVNPYDEESTADTLERALMSEPHDRKERMEALFRRVSRNNVFTWSGRFIEALQQACAARSDRSMETLEPLAFPAVTQAFQAASTRLLLLDYDGTLVHYTNRPKDTVPPASLMTQLAALSQDPQTVIALVSGRSRRDLERWFGHLASVWLVAEHGAIMRIPGTPEWELSRPSLPLEWKSRVKPVLEHFMDRTPGSFLEEKEYSLVWHYRMSDPEFGEWLANELVSTLDEMLAETELRAMRGLKSVEIKLAWANKGDVVQRLLSRYPAPGFVLAAGDDRTDEDMFEHLDRHAWTIHVGPGPSCARYRLDHAGQVQDLLAELGRVKETS